MKFIQKIVWKLGLFIALWTFKQNQTKTFCVWMFTQLQKNVWEETQTKVKLTLSPEV